MGSGGGSDIKIGSSSIKLGNSNDLFNVGANILTGGLVGYDDGKLDPKSGYATRAIDEGIGELTTRNLQREAANEQKKLLQQEAEALKKAQEDEIKRRQAEDIAASAFAGTMTGRYNFGSTGRANGVIGYSAPSDILGGR